MIFILVPKLPENFKIQHGDHNTQPLVKIELFCADDVSLEFLEGRHLWCSLSTGVIFACNK